MILFFIKFIFVLTPMYDYEVRLNDEVERYLSAYKYITTEDSVTKEIESVFKTVQKIEGRKDIMYCIDSIAQPLTISGFGELRDSILRSKIRHIDLNEIPDKLMAFSMCKHEKVNYNLTISVLNYIYLTPEISARFFNPIG